MSDSVVVAIITSALSPVILLLIRHWLDKGNKRLDDIIVSIDNLNTKLDNASNGTRAILRYRLIKDLAQAIARGYTDSSELQEIENLYNSYKLLGGNSVVDGMHEKYLQLEVRL